VSHRARTRTSLLLAVVLTCLVVIFNPTSSGERLRSALGIGQDLTFTITEPDTGAVAPSTGSATSGTRSPPPESAP
jgi:hypothetical protein